MAAPVFPLPGAHHVDCTCKPCLVDAMRDVVHQVVAELMPAAAEQALSVAECAETTGLSDWTIRSLVKAGDLPALRVGTRVHVLRSDLEAWMRRRVAEPLTEVPR